jgi:hypothetical protein
MTKACDSISYRTYLLASSAFFTSTDEFQKNSLLREDYSPIKTMLFINKASTQLNEFREVHKKFFETVSNNPNSYSDCKLIFDAIRSTDYHIKAHDILLQIANPATPLFKQEELLEGYEEVVKNDALHQKILVGLYKEIDLNDL